MVMPHLRPLIIEHPHAADFVGLPPQEAVGDLPPRQAAHDGDITGPDAGHQRLQALVQKCWGNKHFVIE